MSALIHSHLGDLTGPRAELRTRLEVSAGHPIHLRSTDPYQHWLREGWLYAIEQRPRGACKTVPN
jgi:hypothetical protein